MVVYLRRSADFFERHALPCLLAALHTHARAVKRNVLRAHAEHFRAERYDFAAQLKRTLLGRLAGDVGRARSVGAGVIRRGIRIRAEGDYLVERTVEHLRRNLRERSVAAGAHVGRRDAQRIEAEVVERQRRRADVHIRDARALHRHAHADRADLAASHVAHRIFIIPVDHLAHTGKAPVERTARVDLTVVGRHDVALLDDVLLADVERVHAELRGQLVHRALDREKTLRCAVAAVRAGRHDVGINDVARETERLRLAVKRNGLVAGQADRCRAVLAVSARVRERMQVDAAHNAVLGRAEADVHLHLMARRGRGLALDTAENDLGGLFRHPRDERRVNRADSGLLCAEAAADTRLGHTDHAFRDMQRVGDNAARVEHDLGRA